MKARIAKKVSTRRRSGHKYRAGTVDKATRRVAASDRARKRREYEQVVRRPGKFQGEARYVPYFWDAFLDGFADDDDEDGVLSFNVDANDKALFPELHGRKKVRLYERDDGFVVEQ